MGVPGHKRRVARGRERVANEAEHQRVVVHYKDARALLSFLRRTRGTAVEAGNGAAGGFFGYRNGEREPRSQTRSAAFGPDAAPVGFHQPLA